MGGLGSGYCAHTMGCAMADWHQNGKHRMRSDGDAVFWDVQGDIDVDEMRHCLEFGESVIASQGRAFLLINGARARTVTPDARRFQVEWARTHDITNRGRSVVYGTNIFVRALSILVVRASELIAHQTPTVDFVATEADALEWLRVQRLHWAQRTIKGPLTPEDIQTRLPGTSSLT